ncbi:hypothetical protein [Candidatus Thiodiazotropha endoloripes]|uniref:hypothetical protein n=1 Tax=Candidatus Thiodiazotropha endoloripes TaxID=1818881 RepID=UPI00111215CB|nr:hypothetical protein [Candidatus Thiodiazotropha endoloripes]
MSQTTQADFAALEVDDQSNDSTVDYMQPIPGSEQSDLGAYLAAPQPLMNTQGSSTPSRIGMPAPDDAPLLVGDTGVEYGPEISFGAYTQRLLGMGASVPINGIKNFAVGLWDMGAAIFRPSESLSNETNFEYLDIDGSGTYPEPGSGLTSDKIGMALSASINQSNENIRLAKASGNDWSVGWELGNHSLIQATGVGEFAGLSLLSKAGKLVSNSSIFNKSARAEDIFDIDAASPSGSYSFRPFRSDRISLDYQIATKDIGDIVNVRIGSDQIVRDGQIVGRGANTENYIDMQFGKSDGDLFINYMTASEPRLGIGKEMLSRGVEAIGPSNVRSISGVLDETNFDIYRLYREEYGLSVSDAAMQTPAAKIRTDLGYGNIHYDAATRTITGYRN